MPFHNPAFHKYLTRLPLPVRWFRKAALCLNPSALLSATVPEISMEICGTNEAVPNILDPVPLPQTSPYMQFLHKSQDIFLPATLVPGTNSEMEQTLPVSEVPILLLYRLLPLHTQICHRSFLPYRQAASTAPVLPSKNALSHGTDSRF